MEWPQGVRHFWPQGGGAAGAGGFLAGAAGAGIGYTFGTMTQSIGNSIVFNDPMPTAGDFVKGLGVSMLTGGTINGVTALANGRSFLTGTLPVPKPVTIPPLPGDLIKTPEIKPFDARYNDVSQIKLPDQLSHYTANNPIAEGWTSLGRFDDDVVYLTPNSELSTVSATSDLALPKLANFRIDIIGANIDPSKIELIRRVTGNVYNQGGGGWEIIYHGKIDFNRCTVKILKLSR